jgi:hypothetical protein
MLEDAKVETQYESVENEALISVAPKLITLP